MSPVPSSPRLPQSKLNFGMAAEKAKAVGIDVEFHAIGDDVGVGRQKGGTVGRRSIGCAILVLKIIGALVEAGGSLSEVYNLAQQMTSNLVSVGSSMDYVHVPGRPLKDDVDMPIGEIEVGMGIHNEPGSMKVKVPYDELVKIMLSQMLDSKDKDRYSVEWNKDDKWALPVNNPGGLSILEQSAILDEVHRQLKADYGIVPVRVISGKFVTSLNGLGFSTSLLHLQDTGVGAGKSMLELLAAPLRSHRLDRRHQDLHLGSRQHLHP